MSDVIAFPIVALPRDDMGNVVHTSKSDAPGCTTQSRRAFPTNRLCGWKKPLHGNAVRRGTEEANAGEAYEEARLLAAMRAYEGTHGDRALHVLLLWAAERIGRQIG